MPHGGWRRAIWLLLTLGLLLGPAAAHAVGTPEHRVALVIGNAKYAHAPVLKNPANDATAMAKALETLGFDVVSVINGDRLSMVRALSEQAEAAYRRLCEIAPGPYWLLVRESDRDSDQD